MKKPKLGLTKLDASGLIELARTMVSKMTGNANFTTPPTVFATLGAKATATETANNNAQASHSKQDYATLRPLKADLLAALRIMGEYISLTANGDVSIILSAGVPVSKDRSKAKEPEQVTKLIASFTDKTGKVFLSWAVTKYARIFDVYMTTTPTDEKSWVLINSVSARKLMVENLTSGTRYWFRVVAKGIAGNAPASDAADQIAA